MVTLLGRGEGFACPWYLLAILPEEVDHGTILPLRVLDVNVVCRNPGPPYALMCGPYQSDEDATLDVSACPRVWLPPICCMSTGCPFQCNRRLHTQKPVNGGKEGREVSALLEACLQVHFLLQPHHLPHYCNGCNTTFSICHALNYNQDVFVMVRHNKLRDRVADLARKSFKPNHVRDDPLIITGCAGKRPKENTTRSKSINL